ESAAPAVASASVPEADDPSPAAPTQSQTTAVINSSTAIKTSTVESNINFFKEPPSQTVAPTTNATTTAGRLQKSNELIISAKCRKLIVAVEIALHEFISSISGVREFESGCDGGEDYYHNNAGIRRQKRLPASMLKDALIDCGAASSSANTPLAAVVPLEERFAGWANSSGQLNPVTYNADGLHQRDHNNNTDATLHVYAVPIGSVPSLADAEQRTAHWTLGPLRKLFLELWLGTFSASLVVG
ncbi:Hypothetical protein, putative, partial [Bodo saltans]